MEKIIDYVNETPYNTNIGILKDKLRKYSNELMNNAVKSVNGVTPDENGNVEIEIPEGFSGKWDDLEGKPFYEETERNYIFNSAPDEHGLLRGLKLVKGEIYSVEFEGVKYDGLVAGKAMESDSGNPVVFIGNPNESYYFDNCDEDCVNTNVPFIIVYSDTVGVYNPYCMFVDGERTTPEQPVAIYQDTIKIHTLDPKFLPEMSGATMYYVSVANNYICKSDDGDGFGDENNTVSSLELYAAMKAGAVWLRYSDADGNEGFSSILQVVNDKVIYLLEYDNDNEESRFKVCYTKN